MSQNNPALFDALMAGGTGGSLERWITSSSSSSYDSLVDAVEAFATAVDAAIPTIGGSGPSISEINVLQSIAQGIIAGRNLVSIDADTFADIAASIAAVFAEVQPRLNNVPVISGGGGGGGERVPGTAYVATSVATTGNGSPTSPFKTIAEAVTALLADSLPTNALLLFPGDYDSEPTIDWTGESLLIGNAIDLSRAWQGNVPLPSIPNVVNSGFGAMQFNGLQLLDVLDSFGTGFVVRNCEANGDYTCSGGLTQFVNTQMGNGATVSSQNIRFEDCELAAGTYTIAAGTITVFDCSFAAACTFESVSPGLVVIDGWSKALADVVNPILNNITYSVQNATS